MSYETWNKRLKFLSKKHQEGGTIWFARPEFADPNYERIAPKWHVFKDRVKSEGELKHIYVWKARCGYQHKFWEILLDLPRTAAGKTPPPVKERCTKCSAALRKEARAKKPSL